MTETEYVELMLLNTAPATADSIAVQVNHRDNLMALALGIFAASAWIVVGYELARG